MSTNLELKLTSIQIKNFKAIKNLVINSLSEFNVIIGENNIGKSSIFEALLLWKQCYDCSILASSGKGFYKQSPYSSQQQGETFRTLLFEDLQFLRMKNDIDLFYDSNQPIDITLNIEVTLNNGSRIFPLGFSINRTKTPSNSYLKIRYIDYLEFKNFNEHIGNKPKEAIYIYKTQPVATILSEEPFMTNGQILKKISKGKSYEVLRNKIIKRDSNINVIAQKVSQVISENVTLKLNNKRTDEYIDLSVKISEKDLDIHLQGSGLLQIFEIFSSIEYFESALNIVLLDEPDAHIHTTLQRNLINALKNGDEKNQIFVISHSEKFIDNLIEDASLFYLNKHTRDDSGELNILNQSQRLKIKRELGSIITALEEIQDAEKIILVEGSGDIEVFNILIEKFFELHPDIERNKNIHLIYVRGKDMLKEKISFLLQLLPQIIDDKKIAVICDKDFLPLDQVETHEQELRGRLRHYADFIYTHPSYCFETTLLTEQEKLVSFISNDLNTDPNDISQVLQNFITDYTSKVKDASTDEYDLFNTRFETQKKNRSELKSLKTNLVLKSLISEGSQSILTKQLFTDFLRKIDNLGYTTNNTFDYGTSNSSEFVKYYLQNIVHPNEVYECHKNLVENIFEI